MCASGWWRSARQARPGLRHSIGISRVRFPPPPFALLIPIFGDGNGGRAVSRGDLALMLSARGCEENAEKLRQLRRLIEHEHELGFGNGSFARFGLASGQRLRALPRHHSPTRFTG